MKNQKNIAIVTMCFIFAMIAFITHMAAPLGTVWRHRYEWAGMMGNMMNFAAYLFMGIPAGKMLTKVGYKKTTLIALAVGFIGMFIQYASSFEFLSDAAIYVYLSGAFVCGFCVCMLNTVVNPMLNLLGGGGKKGNQLIQTGGTLNSLSATLTPLLIGVLIGTVNPDTSMSDVAILLYIAMGVFAVSFLIIRFLPMAEPVSNRESVIFEHSAWNFRHFVLGALAIFFYVGVEIGIPAEVTFYLSDPTDKGAGITEGGAAIGGAIAAIYWMLMMVGRFLSSLFVAGKVTSRTQVTVLSLTAIILILTAITVPDSITVRMPGYSVADGFDIFQVPLCCMFLILSGICTSVMWGCLFNMSTEGLGKYTEQASGIFMTLCIGGGIMPYLQELLALSYGYVNSFWIVIAMLLYLLYYGIRGCISVNTEIKID